MGGQPMSFSLDAPVDNIIKNAVDLSRNTYGSHVIQQLFKSYECAGKDKPKLMPFVSAITAKLLELPEEPNPPGNFVDLALNRNSSHVIECCLRTCEETDLEKILSLLTES